MKNCGNNPMSDKSKTLGATPGDDTSGLICFPNFSFSATRSEKRETEELTVATSRQKHVATSVNF